MLTVVTLNLVMQSIVAPLLGLSGLLGVLAFLGLLGMTAHLENSAAEYS